MVVQPDLAARLQWYVEHDRIDLVELLAATLPAEILSDALAVLSHEASQ